MAECKHGLEDYSCATCKHGPEVKTSSWKNGAVFPARYDGQCPECDLPTHVGQKMVRQEGDDAVRYVHEWCA